MPKLTEEEHKKRRSAAQKRYRAKHAQQIHADARKRRQEHPEASRLKNIRYRERHPEQDRASKQKYLEKNPTYHQAYYLAHKAEIGAYNKARRAEINAKVRAYYKAHPEVVLARLQRRRAHKLASPINDFDDNAQWEEVQAAFQYRCAYCGIQARGKLTRDHITALSQAGNHTLHNIVPACHACNSGKKDRLPPSPVQPLLLTIAPARTLKRRKKKAD